MSHPSSLRNSLLRSPTADAIRADQSISLVDQERQARIEEQADADDGAEPSDSEATATQPPTPGLSPLAKKLTSNSLQVRQNVKRELTRRKYAKYNQNRYSLNDAPPPPDANPAEQPQLGETASSLQTSYLERGRAKAKTLLKRKRGLGRGQETEPHVVDILYENQRGAFLFGIPKYSSSSLLPSDPRPWQNAQFRTSPVDIRNAQVPDPSWEWAWKSWYVDMSRDVDEEGWEYSFQFAGRFSWHGNHPWFHSFVRRRRWLRMRKRKNVHHHTTEKAHELTAEYFTIHPKTVRIGSEDASQYAREIAKLNENRDDDSDVEKMEIADMGSLMLALRKAAVDREKLLAVRQFVNAGGEELYYLSDRMPDIMNSFIFQSSRKQLLSDLLVRVAPTKDRQKSLAEHTHENLEAQKEHEAASRHTTNLLNAVQAADEQVKKLEYWSDIKGMALGGQTLLDTEPSRWDKGKWPGLVSPTDEAAHPETAFASKQDASEGAPKLHAHPEHDHQDDQTPKNDKDSLKVPSKQSMRSFATKPSTKDSSDGTGSERYTTPAESLSDISGRGGRKQDQDKSARAGSQLDGVDEENEPATIPLPSDDPKAVGASVYRDSADDDHAIMPGHAASPGPSRPRVAKTVQLIDPVAEHGDKTDGDDVGDSRAQGSGS